jgi:hypothetical protein
LADYTTIRIIAIAVTIALRINQGLTMLMDGDSSMGVSNDRDAIALFKFVYFKTNELVIKFAL